MTLISRLNRTKGPLGQAGQAASEYAMTTTILLMGGVGAGAGWPFFSAFIEAFDSYLKSIYFLLTMAQP